MLPHLVGLDRMVEEEEQDIFEEDCNTRSQPPSITSMHDNLIVYDIDNNNKSTTTMVTSTTSPPSSSESLSGVVESGQKTPPNNTAGEVWKKKSEVGEM